MRRALILGGAGLIGQAVASRLLAAGWRVEVTGRDPGHLPPELATAGATFIQVDRADAAALTAAVGDGAHLIVDCACFTGVDAVRLLPLARLADCTVMISSKAVYADAAGHHVNSDLAPRFGGPVTEDQPTVPPSDIAYWSREGYGANKVAAEQVLLDSGAPVTVLRPSKVHGPGARPPREWVFVKRILDRRPAVFLARRGEGVDHTTAAANVAALIETVAAHPGRRVLNSQLAAGHGGNDQVRLAASHDLVRKWAVHLLVRQILLAGEEPYERPSAQSDVVANRAPQYRVPVLQRVQH